MITTAAIACNIRLIVETIIASQTGMTCVKHNAQGTPPHQEFSLLISVDCLSVLVSNIIPECIVHGKMSGRDYTLNIMTTFGPVAETSALTQNPRFLYSQVF